MYGRIAPAKYGQRINERVTSLWSEKSMGARPEATWSLPQKNRRISERLWKRKYRRISGLPVNCGR